MQEELSHTLLSCASAALGRSYSFELSLVETRLLPLNSIHVPTEPTSLSKPIDANCF